MQLQLVCVATVLLRKTVVFVLVMLVMPLFHFESVELDHVNYAVPLFRIYCLMLYHYAAMCHNSLLLVIGGQSNFKTYPHVFKSNHHHSKSWSNHNKSFYFVYMLFLLFLCFVCCRGSFVSVCVIFC